MLFSTPYTPARCILQQIGKNPFFFPVHLLFFSTVTLSRALLGLYLLHANASIFFFHPHSRTWPNSPNILVKESHFRTHSFASWTSAVPMPNVVKPLPDISLKSRPLPMCDGAPKRLQSFQCTVDVNARDLLYLSHFFSSILRQLCVTLLVSYSEAQENPYVGCCLQD